jgi:hypothetical protein
MKIEKSDFPNNSEKGDVSWHCERFRVDPVVSLRLNKIADYRVPNFG